MLFFIKYGSSTGQNNLTGRTVLNLNLLTLLCILGLTVANTDQYSCGDPTPEIVSIYNNKFNIPDGFGPFFIKINRCVDCFTCPYFPMPNTSQLVKTVVQNSITGKVFEYTLRNHTSCMCGAHHLRKKEHYESTVKEVSVAYKYLNEKYNPAYVTDCQPQQRYAKNTDYYYPPFQGYTQCLPMCTTGQTSTTLIAITHISGSQKNVKVTNHNACSIPIHSVSGEDNRPGLNNIFNIDSKKTFFALVLLALVFIIVIIIDLTFCCRKKGFCYSLKKCVQGEEQTPAQVVIQATYV